MIETASMIVGLICLLTGGVVVCYVLLWIGLIALSGIIGRLRYFKRLHAYIKDHKEEFIKWGRENV